MQIAKWYVITLGKNGYEEIVLQSPNPHDIQSFLNFISTGNHFVITIVQLTENQYANIFKELYPEVQGLE